MGWRDTIAKVLAGKVGGSWEGGIRAYHSSPYDFDKVDFSKLRTGEGANVYGAGHYMAENPAVSGQGGQYWQQFLQRFPTPDRRAAQDLAQHGFDREAAAEAVRREAMRRGNPTNEIDADYLAKQMQKLRLLESGQPVGPRTYEMNLRARPEELLDWDKLLSAQPQHLDMAYRLLPHMREAPAATGASFYDVLSSKLRGADFAKEGQERASAALAERGIPGIRYLDQGSRLNTGNDISILNNQLKATQSLHAETPTAYTTKEIARLQSLIERQPPQTYNYVGTDPSKLDILAKYGVGGAAAVPPTLGAFTRQDTYEARP